MNADYERKIESMLYGGNVLVNRLGMFVASCTVSSQTTLNSFSVAKGTLLYLKEGIIKSIDGFLSEPTRRNLEQYYLRIAEQRCSEIF